jgi:hypothetical protein
VTIKELSVALGCICAIGGGFVGYGKLSATATQAKDEVKEVRQEIKKAEEKIDEAEEAINKEENINIRQSIMLENTAKILEKLEKKL